MTEEMQDAIIYLNAVEVAPRYYAFEKPGGGYMFASRTALLENYRQRCGAVFGVDAPAWWTPEQRFALRDNVSGNIYAQVDNRDDAVKLASEANYTALTANYETGEEVLVNDG